MVEKDSWQKQDLGEELRSAKLLLEHSKFPGLIKEISRIKNYKITEIPSDGNEGDGKTVGMILEWDKIAKAKTAEDPAIPSSFNRKVVISCNSEGRIRIIGARFFGSTTLSLGQWLDHDDAQRRAFRKAMRHPQVIKTPNLR